MRERVARLSRLHTLRCRLADAAIAERRRLEQEIELAQQAASELRNMAAAAIERADHMDSPWLVRRAQLDLAARQTESWMQRGALLQSAHLEATTRERAAVQAQEQISRMVSRMERELRLEAERREQRQLDDLFAVSRVRAAMTTAF